ncbi:hypothetical protein ACIQ9P_09925 [Kitasatospora sp. NPDC094019]|uniref:hypothetical protein n=1 Tax=Kitasatospora sp. NPDC094019 TaxID=3364091 RepID=UPI0038222B28
MAIFRKPGRSGQPEPTPDRVADELAGLVEELEPAAPGAPPEGEAGELAEYREGVERGRRRGSQLVTDISRRLGSGSRAAAKGAAFGGRALADQLLQAAPRIPVRDLATLRAQHPGATDPEQLADLLVTGAGRASSALGAGVGAAAMLPVPPAMPVEIAAETLAVAAVEVKLIAELHEVYGLPAQGTATQKASAYVTAWANRRGIDGSLLVKPAGLAAMALGSEVRQQVRRRLTRSSLRRLPSLTPLLVGAGIGATVNLRDTRKVAREVREDLRGRRPVDPGYWAAAAPAPRPTEKEAGEGGGRGIGRGTGNGLGKALGKGLGKGPGRGLGKGGGAESDERP